MVARQVLKVIPSRVRQARALTGLSQEELGEALGCHARTVGNWESGASQPRSFHLRQLSEVTGKPVPWFFGEQAA